ncbi:hypothetical protein P4O66_019293, partial [Electrophorus voltai]
KMPAALNLSNEVVKMRAEVKRVKVLVCRKLTRQIAALKRKKGTQADLERYQRRAARLLEEMHELKALAPDNITKTALQQDISFQKVCQNKAASLSERATARVATHPDFSRRIQSLKDAVKAFSAERLNAVEAQTTAELESGGSVLQLNDSELESDGDEGLKEELIKGKNKEHEGDDVQGFNKVINQDQCVSVTTKEKSLEADITPTEVVRMRKQVKKLRMLLIYKVTQKITSLRREKDKDLKVNQQCITSLQKEVQVLRDLLPDHVTITALQGKMDLEYVLQDPKSSSLERATAQIATHPRFVKKLQDVRKAIEEERTKVASAKQRNVGKEDFSEVKKDEDSDGEEEEEVEDKADEDMMVTDDSDDDDDDDKTEDKRKKDQPLKDEVIKNYNAIKLSEDTKLHTVNETAASISKEGVTEKDVESSVHLKSDSEIAVTVGVVKSMHCQETPVMSAPPPGRNELITETKKPENRGSKEENDSDLSDGEEEREYFDDSTEERFHKQSSQSEESDDDDFFLGKVSKLKKKKSDGAAEKEKKSDPTKVARLQKAKEAGDARQEFKMQSVFCSTLSKSSDAYQKGKGCNSKPLRLQNQKKCSDGNAKPTWFKSQDPRNDRRRVAFNKLAAGPKGPGPGTRITTEARFGRIPAQGSKGGPGKVNRPQHSQQTLHPSWEASRKRKEQQAQITGFQGKKIKFDDD